MSVHALAGREDGLTSKRQICFVARPDSSNQNKITQTWELETELTLIPTVCLSLSFSLSLCLSGTSGSSEGSQWERVLKIGRGGG